MKSPICIVVVRAIWNKYQGSSDLGKLRVQKKKSNFWLAFQKKWNITSVLMDEIVSLWGETRESVSSAE